MSSISAPKPIIDSAYAQNIRGPQKARGGGSEEAQKAGTPSFEKIMEGSVGSAIDTIRKSETVAQQHIAGSASVQEVVEASTNAEMVVQSTVALRDRMIESYNAILRMPI